MVNDEVPVVLTDGEALEVHHLAHLVDEKGLGAEGDVESPYNSSVC
jgi:hypothetical protein